MNLFAKIIVFSQTAWGKIKRHPFWTASVLAAAGLGLMLILIYGFGLKWSAWTGFGEYYITRVDPATRQVIEEEVHYRTLWDLLDLLIIPAVLAGGVFWFNRAARRNEDRIAIERNEMEQGIAIDRQQHVALQVYFDLMTELLLDKALRFSSEVKSEGKEVRSVARTWTLRTLRTMDPMRKGLLLKFLFEAELIQELNPVLLLAEADLREAELSGARLNGAELSGVDLSQARLRNADLGGTDLSWSGLNGADLVQVNLSGADLSWADLNKADLSEANLSQAYLFGADMSRADLSGADLSGADLWGADLSGARLWGAVVTEIQLARAKTLEGATMPDGVEIPR